MFNIPKLINYIFENMLILTSNNQLHIYNGNYYNLDKYIGSYNLDALEAGYLHSINYKYHIIDIKDELYSKN